jgi:hypothetical protein
VSGPSARRRLAQLEERLRPTEGCETARARAVHGRTTVEELRGYVWALRRRRDGKAPAEGDGAIFARARRLYEEVDREHGA